MAEEAELFSICACTSNSNCLISFVRSCDPMLAMFFDVKLADGGVESLEADVILLSTGSRPRIPDWCTPDGGRFSPPATPIRRPRFPST